MAIVLHPDEVQSVLDAIRPMLPEGTRIREITGNVDNFRTFDFTTDYAPELAVPGEAPYLRTVFSWYATKETTDGLRRGIARHVEGHNDGWAFIHSPERASAMAKAVA